MRKGQFNMCKIFFMKMVFFRSKKICKLKKQSFRQKGQVTVEYILLAVILIALFQVMSIAFKENETLKGFQEKPQNVFAEMVENGNWHDTDKSRKRHPNHYESQYTSKAKRGTN